MLRSRRARSPWPAPTPAAGPPPANPDQARRRDLRREPVVRPLLRHLSGRDEPPRASRASTAAPERRRSTVSRRPCSPPTRTRQNPRAPRSLRGRDLRPQPQLRRRAEGLQRRPMNSSPRTPAAAAAPTSAIVMAYYDGNTRHRRCGTYAQHFAMSDRHLRHDVRPVDDRRDQPHQRQHARGQQPQLGRGRDDDRQLPAGATTTARWHGRRLATFSGHNIGDLMNAARRHLGLVRGRLQADVVGSQRRRGLRRHAAQRRRRGRRRLPPAPRAVPVLRLDRQPAPPAADLGRRDRHHRPGQPPVRPDATSTPPGRPATCRRSRS